MKNPLPVGAELFRVDGQTDRQTDRQTDMTRLIVAFRNCANAPKNGKVFLFFLHEDM